jgi:tetratricopeptide (TPR) repeat protein
MKEIELLIKNENYDEAEKALNKALVLANSPIEKKNLQSQIKALYERKAEELEKRGKSNKATRVYEKILAIDKNQNPEVMKKLLSSYNRLGKIKEAIALEGNIKNPPKQEEKPKPFNVDELFE